MEQHYTELPPGAIISTKGVASTTGNDQLLTGDDTSPLKKYRSSWLDAPSCWNGSPVPEHIRFRRPTT